MGIGGELGVGPTETQIQPTASQHTLSSCLITRKVRSYPDVAALHRALLTDLCIFHPQQQNISGLSSQDTPCTWTPAKKLSEAAAFRSRPYSACTFAKIDALRFLTGRLFKKFVLTSYSAVAKNIKFQRQIPQVQALPEPVRLGSARGP